MILFFAASFNRSKAISPAKANPYSKVRNTGFKKILDALKASGSPKPEFETDEDKSYFITRLFIHS